MQANTTQPAEDRYDALVVGGGPAGATTAMVLARAGRKVLLAERERFPRFHVGESFLPRNWQLIKELGLEDAVARLPHVPKYGAEFAFPHDSRSMMITFEQSLIAGEPRAINIARAPFDAMLMEQAGAAGAEIVETHVGELSSLADGDVRSTVGGREIRARWMVDASGQATFLGKRLGLRRVLPDLRKVAYFGHFENVRRNPGKAAGHITIVMLDEGWFWSIPLCERLTSIGLVMRADRARESGIAPDRMLSWAIERCPLMRERTAEAVFPERTHVVADFSYTCKPYSGPGYFMVGDAATFVDPIFSTGVCLGMMSGVEAARGIDALLDRPGDAAAVRRRYNRFVDGSSASFFRLVRGYYDHSFRELFMNGRGPLDMHRAVIGLLAGHVFPRPGFPLRWRLGLFDLCRVVQRRFPLVPPRESFSLLQGAAVPRAAALRVQA